MIFLEKFLSVEIFLSGTVSLVYSFSPFISLLFLLQFSSDILPDFEVKLKYSNLDDTLPKNVDLKCLADAGTR